MPTAPTDPVRAARWRVLALLFVCRTALGLQFQTMASVSDAVVTQFGFSYTQIGTLIGLFMLPGLLLSLPAGWAGRRVSDRRLVALGLLAMGVGGAIGAVAQGFGWLALGRLVCGAGFVFSTIYFTKMAVDWFAGLELATALGILVMSWPLGIAAGQVGHAWLAVNVDWRAAFAAATVWCLAAAAAMALVYRSPASGATAAVAQAAGLPRDELLLTLLAASAWGLFNAGYVVYLSFAPRVLVAAGYGSTRAAAVVSLASWVMIFSVTVAGRLADRSGRHTTVVVVCGAVAVASLLLLPHAEHAVLLSLAFGLMGAAPAGIVMALTAQAMAPQRRAFGMGVFFSCYFVLMTAAPPLAGWLYDRSGNAYAALVFGALLFALAVLSYAAFAPLKRRLSRG